MIQLTGRTVQTTRWTIRLAIWLATRQVWRAPSTAQLTELADGRLTIRLLLTIYAVADDRMTIILMIDQSVHLTIESAVVDVLRCIRIEAVWSIRLLLGNRIDHHAVFGRWQIVVRHNARTLLVEVDESTQIVVPDPHLLAMVRPNVVDLVWRIESGLFRLLDYWIRFS